MASQTRSPYLKAFALTSTFAVGSAMTATSGLFAPALLRPLLYSSSTSLSQPQTPSVTRPSSSLNVPQTPVESGRLTPQPSNRSFDFNFPGGSSGTYKAVAQQFCAFERAAFRVQVPLEFASIIAFGVVAYRARSAGSALWTHWAAAAGLIASVFPFTGALMAPLQHKIARVAGEEEKIEPYEDAPIDREAEKSNTVNFIKQWTMFGTFRALVVLGAVAVGSRAYLLE